MIPSSESLKKSFSEFSTLITPETGLVDIRLAPAAEYIKNSIFIIFNEKFKVLMPSVLKTETPLLVSCEPSKTDEMLQALRECGYSNIVGFLDGGFESWATNKGETARLNPIENDTFKSLYEAKPQELAVLDVRNKNEWVETGVLSCSRLLSLKDLEQEIRNGSLDDLKKRKIHVFCQMGPRSIIASSILKKNGFDDVEYIVGGFKKLLENGLEIKKLEI